MKISTVKEFGEIIRNKRKSLGYTQAYVASVSGLSISFISDLERGKQTIELGKAMLLASLLGMDVLLNDRGNK
ncbi:MAG: helix-turn-helix domain-containing protein [Acidaminococcaceae bacterium]|nr:helix-turn-helix domain-containing protein [Acidaminococcaceae bacterium]MDO4935916.1 helix-turn-helix domain-containing protein [Phascolarctobacterium sp.]